MHNPTHTLFDHFRAYIHAKRRLAWSYILPVSKIMERPQGIVRHVAVGRY